MCDISVMFKLTWEITWIISCDNHIVCTVNTLVLAQSWSNLGWGEIQPSGLASVLPSSALALLPIYYGHPTSEIHQSSAELGQAQQGDNRGAHGSCFWSIFDSLFVHFCRHRSSKTKSKMNWKMRSVNLTPSKFSKMRSKMSEKWNNTFFGTLAALNSTARCRLCFILSLSEYYFSASNLPRVFTNYSLVYSKCLISIFLLIK